MHINFIDVILLFTIFRPSLMQEESYN